jgi:hypothetical protein
MLEAFQQLHGSRLQPHEAHQFRVAGVRLQLLIEHPYVPLERGIPNLRRTDEIVHGHVEAVQSSVHTRKGSWWDVSLLTEFHQLIEDQQRLLSVARLAVYPTDLAY